MPKSALVPIANGSEEIEAICIIDTLRRAGVEVTVAGVPDRQITASRNVRLVADTTIEQCAGREFDAIVLPGGMPGARNLSENEHLIQMLKTQQAEGRLYGAICAAPAVALQPHGLLTNRTATAHPGFYDTLHNPAEPDRRVVIDGSCITSRGPGTALEFALTLVEALVGVDQARSIGESMVMLPRQLP
jgi:4-methyl-5(b-hydroxyethyl)-thiazole monophosphate biosynthesis